MANKYLEPTKFSVCLLDFYSSINRIELTITFINSGVKIEKQTKEFVIIIKTNEHLPIK